MYLMQQAKFEAYGAYQIASLGHTYVCRCALTLCFEGVLVITAIFSFIGLLVGATMNSKEQCVAFTDIYGCINTQDSLGASKAAQTDFETVLLGVER